MTISAFKVTVIGSGYMGKGIAQTLARGGATVTLVDQEADVAERALATMIEDVATGERQGLLEEGASDVVRERTTWESSIATGVPGAGLVIEAVYEDIDLKHRVLMEIEAHASDNAIIATNTSAIPVGDLAIVLTRPERFFGIHWYNPAPYMPGIEIILGEKSDESLLNPSLELLRNAGKDPVKVADTPGFIANRLQFALFKEAALMVEEGTATPAQIDHVVKSAFGFRLPFFGPFAIADMAGLDVYANSYKTLAAQLGSRFDMPECDAGGSGCAIGCRLQVAARAWGNACVLQVLLDVRLD